MSIKLSAQQHGHPRPAKARRRHTRDHNREIALRAKARAVYRCLRRRHPDAHIELKYTHPFELLVATILSAQCTDTKVNDVTRELFQRFRNAADYARARPSEIEEIIRPTGFFRQKARNIRAAAKAIVEKHSGKVPQSIEELVALPGVGRKTANVILGNAFSIPGLAVDTHVSRLSRRIGLTRQENPERIEAELCALFPKRDWTQLSHTLIFHGRRICKARKPECGQCPITALCDYYQEQNV